MFVFTSSLTLGSFAVVFMGTNVNVFVVSSGSQTCGVGCSNTKLFLPADVSPIKFLFVQNRIINHLTSNWGMDL